MKLLEKETSQPEDGVDDISSFCNFLALLIRRRKMVYVSVSIISGNSVFLSAGDRSKCSTLAVCDTSHDLNEHFVSTVLLRNISFQPLCIIDEVFDICGFDVYWRMLVTVY